LDFEVAFLGIPDAVSQGRGFGVAFQWDVPLRDGYRSGVLASRDLTGGHGFLGKWLPASRSVLRALRPDVLLLTGWQCLPLVQLLLAARSLGIPVLMRGESNALMPRRFVTRWIHRRLLSMVSAFLVIGKANRKFYENYGIDDHRLYDAPYFVDNEAFALVAAGLRPRRAEIRGNFGILPNAVCFLFAGKFEAKKRPLDLVQAIASVRRVEAGTPIQALMVGAGTLDTPLRARAARDDLPVQFAGFLNQGEIARAYVAADALVLPSDVGETWGLVVNEAMACGLPAIVSDRVGCGADLVESGVTGEVVPFADVGALADTLVRLSRDPARLAEMGKKAERRVRERYTVERSADAVVRSAKALTGRQV
jgi:glycosyltransferase involved in cell wall biosynthesis